MKLPRRGFLHMTTGAMTLPLASRFAWAQNYLSRPVRIIVGFAPGSSPDIIARLMAQSLSERLGQQFMVDNRPGVGGNIATEVVVTAEPDGHTLLMVGPSSAIDATLYEKLSFNFRHDIAPVAALVHSPNVMLVNPSVPARTVAEFIALAKANPDRFNMASAGVGTATHLSGELFKMLAGVGMVHVPYRGGADVYADLLGGAADVYFPTLASSIDYIKSGQLRALAVTTAQRVEGLPGIPAMGETVPGYQASTWFGVGAPRNTPVAIVDWLNREINASLAERKVKAQIAELGGTAIAGSPADFGRLIAAETAKWASVIKVSATA